MFIINFLKAFSKAILDFVFGKTIQPTPTPPVPVPPVPVPTPVPGPVGPTPFPVHPAESAKVSIPKIPSVKSGVTEVKVHKEYDHSSKNLHHVEPEPTKKRGRPAKKS